MIIVGVTGFKRCGKDTTCNLLMKQFGFTKMAFADPLREMVLAINPMISISGAPDNVIGQLHYELCGRGEYGPMCTAYRYADIIAAIGYERGKEIPDLRGILQRIGTEGVRSIFGDDAWVDAMTLRVERTAPSLLCIPDVRFRNEADWILARGGIIWRVSRPGFGGTDPHPSEAEIPSLPVTRDVAASTLPELTSAILSAAQADLGLAAVAVPSSPNSDALSASPSTSSAAAHDHGRDAARPQPRQKGGAQPS